MTDVLLVLCTAPADAAPKLAQAIVEARLAACVNVLPDVQSFYWWNGSLESSREVQMLMKTTRDLYEKLESFIRANHPYTVAEVLALEIAQGSAPYLDWVRSETRQGP